MLVDGRTTVRERIVLMGSMSAPSAVQKLTWIRDTSTNRRCGGRERAGEQGSRPGTLAAFEVPIARAHGILTACHRIAIHADAHGAARFTPVRACIDEDAMQPFCFSRLLDLLRTGYHEHLHAF